MRRRILCLFGVASGFAQTSISADNPIAMYTPPWLASSDAEDRARYPPWLRLDLVQVIHRHGPRTPLNYRLPEFYPFAWPLCSRGSAHALIGAAGGGPRVRIAGNEADEFGHVADTKITLPHAPHANCLLGQLTDIGMAAMESLGEHLRRLYIASGRLAASPESTHMRSTNYPRTIQSVHALFRGIFPAEEARMRRRGEAATVHVKDSIMENMESTSRCARYKALLRSFDRAVAERLRPEAQALRSAFPHLFATNDLFGRQHSIYGVYETLTSYIAHGLPVPPGVDASLMERLEAYVAQEIYTVFRESGDAVRFSVGRFVKEILANLESPGATRLAVYSAHDTTLAPMLAALGHPVDRNPPYCSAIAIELASDTRDGAQYVRTLYNNRPLAIPECARPGAHHPAFPDGSLCSLRVFIEAMQRHVPADFLAECVAGDQSPEAVVFR